MRPLLIFFCVVVGLMLARSGHAQPVATKTAEAVPTRYGVGLLVGSAYDPDNFELVIVQGQLLLDYDRVFRHAAPETLRLKIEAAAGICSAGNPRGLLAVNALALNYLEFFQWRNWTPYVEAGIGLIYTDFQVAGQGLRFNFNPQAGVGVEQVLSGAGAVTAALRLQHISNGNTHQQNRGINAVLLQIGYLF